MRPSAILFVVGITAMLSGCASVPSEQNTQASEYTLWPEYHDGVGQTIVIKPAAGLDSCSIELWNRNRYVAPFRIQEIKAGHLKAICTGAWNFNVTASDWPQVRVLMADAIHTFDLGDPHLGNTNAIRGTKIPWQRK